MKNFMSVWHSFPRQLAIVALAFTFPAVALHAQSAQSASDPQSTPPAATAQQQPSPEASPALTPQKEGFWGRVNPWARKKWVKKQTDPINDRLGELDQVNAKNAADIKDVDARSQEGIRKAQSTADAANQTATAAGTQAQQAGMTAQNASTHVDQLNTTVNGLDQYHQISEVELKFRGGSPMLSSDAKTQLDALASSLDGHQGYIVEMEAHSPAAGSAGIQNSERLAESVKRYLVTEHEIPVYRLHAVALGNARDAATGTEDTKPVRFSSVHIRLMENSLAAQESAPPHGAVSSTGAERP
jgi:outer membrane protein OmpA-like peptidoglycan-associated protein